MAPGASVSPALLLCLHSHPDPLMGFLQFLSLSVVFPASPPSDMDNLYGPLGFIISLVSVCCVIFLLSPFCHLSSSRAGGLKGLEISSACLVHLFGFSSSDLISALSPSSLLLLDKYILQSMCTLKDDSRLDRWVWPLRAQHVTVG